MFQWTIGLSGTEMESLFGIPSSLANKIVKNMRCVLHPLVESVLHTQVKSKTTYSNQHKFRHDINFNTIKLQEHLQNKNNNT